MVSAGECGGGEMGSAQENLCPMIPEDGGISVRPGVQGRPCFRGERNSLGVSGVGRTVRKRKRTVPRAEH